MTTLVLAELFQNPSPVAHTCLCVWFGGNVNSGTTGIPYEYIKRVSKTELSKEKDSQEVWMRVILCYWCEIIP